MIKSFAPLATSAALLIAAATAASVPDGTWPTSTGSVQYTEAYTVKAGEVFDGKMQTFERSDISCDGQSESGSSTAVFLVEAGGTLKNAIIGVNQMEGVHCDNSDCTIDNVWWDDVCEDALSIKGGTASSVSTVTGGGARSADDKVIQHNGLGSVKIDGFYGEDISKLYRSCGTCGAKARKVSVSNVYVVNPGNAIVTVNKNWNDEATLSNIWVKSSGDKVKICQWSQGNADGEPSMLGDGPSAPLCQYSESDVHINGDVSQATGTSGSSTSTETASSSTGSSATSQVSTNSTADASDASDVSAPGTVAPANTESGESSQSEQQQSSEKSTDESEQQQQSNASENTDDDSDKKSSDDTDSDKNQEEEEENNDDAQNEEQTIVSSAADSNTSSDSSNTGSTVQSSSTGSTTQSSNAGSATQSSDSDSPTQTATNTSTNTNTSTSTSTGSVPDGTWPASTGTVLYKEPYTIKAGEVFDGKMQTFERSDVTCSEGEGQKDTAVFLVEAGGTLKNAIIGKNQKEGVHCDDHDCTIENVWWDDVCEDALSIKGGSASSVTTVTNCGARYASDKVVQHNGYGTVKIDGFYAQEFGKLYRSCGTCGDIPRIVTVENVYAVDPLVSVVTVNKNYGDQATLKNIRVKTTDGSTDVKVCQWSQGGSTPSNVGDGPSGTLCQYSESDVQINQ